jgi:hypothetical protein
VVRSTPLQNTNALTNEHWSMLVWTAVMTVMALADEVV